MRQVAVRVRLTLHGNADVGAVERDAHAAIQDYFRELAQSWADEERLVVRLSQIETRLLDISGVLDVEESTIEGERRNLVLEPLEIPSLRELEVRG